MVYMETNFGLKADEMEDGLKHGLFNIHQICAITGIYRVGCSGFFMR